MCMDKTCQSGYLFVSLFYLDASLFEQTYPIGPVKLKQMCAWKIWFRLYLSKTV